MCVSSIDAPAVNIHQALIAFGLTNYRPGIKSNPTVCHCQDLYLTLLSARRESRESLSGTEYMRFDPQLRSVV
jgi:hypothetical protein